jgi:hypothetical protein
MRSDRGPWEAREARERGHSSVPCLGFGGGKAALIHTFQGLIEFGCHQLPPGQGTAAEEAPMQASHHGGRPQSSCGLAFHQPHTCHHFDLTQACVQKQKRQDCEGGCHRAANATSTPSLSWRSWMILIHEYTRKSMHTIRKRERMQVQARKWRGICMHHLCALCPWNGWICECGCVVEKRCLYIFTLRGTLAL